MIFNIILTVVIVWLSIRLILLEEKFKELTKYLGVEQLFED